jgi:hypothetical protein
MKNFTKIVRLGFNKDTGNTYVKISFKDKKLSITGVEGPLNNGDCKGSCGQIEMSIDKNYFDDFSFAPNWDKEQVLKLVKIWREWHLNDLRAGCKHQRKNNIIKDIELIEYTWSDKFYKMRKDAEKGKLSRRKYMAYKKLVPKVHGIIFGYNKPKYPTNEIKELLKAGYIKEDEKETKQSNWVSYKEHPEGLLSKPCSIYGYKYGTKWLHEDVPENILEWLYNLPDTDKNPAWI